MWLTIENELESFLERSGYKYVYRKGSQDGFIYEITDEPISEIEHSWYFEAGNAREEELH